MTEKQDPLNEYVQSALDEMKQGLETTIKAKIIAEMGDQFSVQQLAQGVFGQKPGWGAEPGETWIDALMRRALEKRIEAVLDGLLDEKGDELEALVKAQFEKMDIAETASKFVMNKFKSLVKEY